MVDSIAYDLWPDSFLESLFLLTVFFPSNINAGVRVGYYMCMGM